jgi:hypothetical protein
MRRKNGRALRGRSFVAQDYGNAAWGRETIVMAKRPETVTVEIQLFHVFVLPALWFVDMLWLWIVCLGVNGGKGMPPIVLGWVGWWLACFAMPLKSIVPFILLDCIGGVLTMGLMGFFQDALRVPKWVVAMYPALTIILVAHAAVREVNSFPSSSGDFIRGTLAGLCVSIYAVSFLSCLLAVGWWIVRKWRNAQ